MTVNIEREKAKRKIIALLNKTVDKGATESEAMLAAEKASELMAFYDVECGELEFQEKNIVKESVACKSYARREYVSSAAMGIAKLCQTRVWKCTGVDKFVYFGFKHDVDIAVAMFSYLEDAALRAVEDFEESATFEGMINGGYAKKSVIMSFIKGFDSRIHSRLSEMAKERDKAVILSTGTSLVPMKESEIDREMKAQGMRLVSRSCSSRISSGDAYRAGGSAAANVSLSSQVSGSNSSRRLA